MRAITISVLLVILLATAIYSFLLSDDPQPLSPEISLSNNISERPSSIAKLLAILEKYEKKNEERFNQSVSEQKQMKKVVAVLASRLASLEEVASAQIVYEQGSNDISDPLNKHTEDSSSPEISEPTLSQWMDNTMEFEYWDEAATEQASVEVADSLSKKLPGVNLEGMKCGDGFCRAMLAQVDGEYPNVRSLMGMPPFVSEGFTKNGDDGKLLVYFTESGVTFDDLRNVVSGESN